MVRYLSVILIIFIEFLLRECTSYQNNWKTANYRFGKDFPKCSGKLQSPIEIDEDEVIPVPSTKLKFYNYNRQLSGPILVKNNGYSIDFDLPKNAQLPYITGGLNLIDNYELVSFHFHWGKTSSRGSEHIINNRQYPLEMHLVHINRKYNRDKSKALKYKDGLAVIAVLYQLDDSESSKVVLGPVVKHLKNVINSDQKEWIRRPSFTIKSLFPSINTLLFYEYKGSLTTPPCTENVNWIVFAKTQLLPINQFLEFRILKDENGLEMSDNFRKVQPSNGRPIYFHTKQLDVEQDDPNDTGNNYNNVHKNLIK